MEGGAAVNMYYEYATCQSQDRSGAPHVRVTPQD